MALGTVLGAAHRLIAGLAFHYDFKEGYAGEVTRSGLAAWLLVWLGLDLWAYIFLQGASWWWLAGGPGSALVLWFVLPYRLSVALLGVQIARAALSLLVGSMGFIGVSPSILGPGILVIQLWTLVADIWLMLLYLRTPKRLMAGNAEHTAA